MPQKFHKKAYLISMYNGNIQMRHMGNLEMRHFLHLLPFSNRTRKGRLGFQQQTADGSRHVLFDHDVAERTQPAEDRSANQR